VAALVLFARGSGRCGGERLCLKVAAIQRGRISERARLSALYLRHRSFLPKALTLPFLPSFTC
jgi:hypothetical protein